MSTRQALQSEVVEMLDEPIVDDNPDMGAATVEAPKPVREQLGVSQWIRRSPAKVGIAVLVMLAVASVALATWMYVLQYRSDQQIDPAAEKAVLTAATEGSVALLSYSPDSIDRDLATANSHLTGEFLTYYRQFTDEIVRPAAKQKSIKSSATIARAAISEMHTDSAVVLLFVNQTSTSSDRPEPSLLASSVLVTLTNVDGNWLIAKFEPV
ncbi:MAG: Mce-associated rane protein [Mycobacterium sp.]|jgi:Mce-associated membrane protein|nr:Mce-associated rane protein [Mycobacterium sp.]